jgi:hypothetical protein
MMKESLIFFALLIVVLIGFLQAFIGMDSADDNAITAIGFISTQMVRIHSLPCSGFQFTDMYIPAQRHHG